MPAAPGRTAPERALALVTTRPAARPCEPLRMPGPILGVIAIRANLLDAPFRAHLVLPARVLPVHLELARVMPRGSRSVMVSGVGVWPASPHVLMRLVIFFFAWSLGCFCADGCCAWLLLLTQRGLAHFTCEPLPVGADERACCAGPCGRRDGAGGGNGLLHSSHVRRSSSAQWRVH